jgi:hypothetical protein
MATPESKVKAKIKRTLKKHYPGAWSFMPVQMGYGQHGVPDILCCIPMTIRSEHVGKTFGVFVGIEAKADTGKLSKHQAHQIKLIGEATGLAFVVRGVGERFNLAMDRLHKLIYGEKP